MPAGSGSWAHRAQRAVENRVVWVVVAVLGLGAAGVYAHLGRISDQLVEAAALGEAQRYSRALAEFRTLYTSEVVANARAGGVEVSHDYAHKRGAIPLPATLSMLLGSRLTGSGGVGQARLYSDHPFPWRQNDSLLDEFEVNALTALRSNPNQPYYEFKEYDGTYVLRYATADTMREACVGCHNTHPESPKTDWVVGDVRGVLEIITPLDEAVAQTSAGLRSLVMLFAAIGLIGFAAGYVVILRLRHDAEALKTSNQRLEVERRRAEDASEAKGQFLAHMSHEIRTPLNAVIGMSGMLEDTDLDREQKELVHTVHASGEALLSIINDILDFSKIEAGQVDLERVPFSLDGCAEDTIDLVALAAHAKGLELSYFRQWHVPERVVGDVTRLRQILLNLLSNAIKFTAAGEVALNLDADETKSGALRLHFSVRDTGPGIPPDGLKRLFHSFSQVDASTTRKYGGTGLGLAISKRFAELMGGEMWVESEVGRGSIFHVSILAEAAPEPEDPEVSRGLLRGRQVLVVDDNATNRDVLRRQVESFGMHPTVCASGTDALDAVSTGAPFDVVILDLLMPGMDGLELGAHIESRYRERGKTAPPMILLASGGLSSGRPEDAERRLNQARRYAGLLSKPVRGGQLLESLVHALGGRVRANADTAPQASVPTREPESVRILLTEDNHVNQKVAVKMLERLGYRADVAPNGLEAVTRAQSTSYDIILMDLQMPEMDGLEATRRIRARGTPTSPWIIALTANASADDRRACHEAGMNDFITKPVTMRTLQGALLTALENGSDEPAPAETAEREPQE